MIKQLLTLIVAILAIQTCFPQQDSVFRHVKDYKGTITDFTVDNLGNLFLLYQNGQLKKLKPNGDSLAVYNNVRRFGKLHSIDVSNPLKVLLYYKNFGTVVILDRFLNERSSLDLRKQNLLQVKAIGQSYDNHMWVFDEMEAKLKKIGDDGQLIDQTSDFRLIFDSAPSPETIMDHEKNVYLYDKSKGIYVFDYYGGFRSRIPFTGWWDVRVINNAVFGRDHEKMYRYEPGTLELKELPLPEFMRTAKKLVVAPGFVYLLRDGAIMVYSYGHVQ